MPSMREQVLSALFGQLQAVPHTVVKRNEALPASVPAGGLVILRDGDPGEPDVTLNPRSEFYTHRAEIEAFVTQPVGGGGEAVLDALLVEIGTALAADRSLGGSPNTCSGARRKPRCWRSAAQHRSSTRASP
jgi:hypothetical protein